MRNRSVRRAIAAAVTNASCIGCCVAPGGDQVVDESHPRES